MIWRIEGCIKARAARALAFFSALFEVATLHQDLFGTELGLRYRQFRADWPNRCRIGPPLLTKFWQG